MVVGVLLLAAAPIASAQNTDNPVFPDVSPLARDGLASVPGLIAAENWPEAIRTLAETLDQHADQVLESPDRPGVFISVRQRVHELLLSRGELLDRYRRVRGPEALAMLEAGDHADVERTMLMTSAGFEAALRVSEEHLRSARFETARLTLMQLVKHPDMHGDRAAQAASVLTRINQYLDRPGLNELVAEWSHAEAPETVPIEWPASARTRSFDPSLPAGPLEVESLTGVPLRSISFGERAMIHPARSAGMDIVPPAWVFPLAVDDRVYLNDGYRVTAFDRYSLRPHWVSELSQVFDIEVQSMRINEPTSLVYAPGLLLGITGVVSDNGERWGDPRLHAIDIETGRRLWSVLPGELDDRLRGAIFRGEPVIEGNRAVVIARRADPSRRAVSVFLVSVSLADGKAQWVRSIASAGSVGFSREIAAGDWLLLHHGVVYMADRIGAVAAVEAGTGRTRWLRLDTAPPRRSGARVMTWGVQRPIVQDGSIVVLNSDRRRVLWIDQLTGGLVGSMGAPKLNDTPQCLVRVDADTLAVVSHASIGLIESDPQRAEASAPRLTGLLDDQGLTGRPFAINGRLLAPITDAMIVIDPAQPRRRERIELEGAGNVVALESQLLVANDRELRSFLVWDVARDVLQARIEADPLNPDPALTLAELAFRSGRNEAVIGSLDHALNIVGQQADHPLRVRAYDTVLSMLEIGGSHWVYDSPAARTHRELAFDGFELPEALLERLERIATSTQQRVGVLMLTGRLAQAREQAARAVKAYQSIVLDPELSGSVWSSRALTIGADREAARRLREVLMKFGTGSYQEYEARAQRELASADGRADPAGVAQRYPVARAAASAWLRDAELRAEAGEKAKELTSLEAGAQVVAFRAQLADPVEPEIAGELYGRVVSRLVEAGRLAAARRMLDTASEHPAWVLTLDGKPINAAALLDNVGEQLGQRGRLPVVGSTIGTTPQVLEGWRLALPMIGAIETRPDRMVTMIDDRRGVLGVFEARPGPDGATLERRWERPFDTTPFVMHVDEQRVLVYTEVEQGRYVELIDALSGQSQWRVGPINKLLRMPDHPRRRGGGVQTALDGWRQPDDLLLAMDTQSLVLAARNGFSMAISLDDGRSLWQAELPMDRVVDLSAADGQVVVVGDKAVGRRRTESRMLVLDTRSGERIHQSSELGQPYRWAKMTDRGLILVGVDTGVLAVHTRTGLPAWAAREPVLSETHGAWVLGDRVLVVAPGGDLLLGDAATGQFAGPLKRRASRREMVGLQAWLDRDRVVVVSDQGVRIYDTDGRLIASDGLVGLATLLTPAAGDGVALLIERDPIRSASGSLVYRIRLIDTTTGKLLDGKRLNLPEPPAVSTLLDGLVIVSTPSVSVVLPMGE